MNTSVCKMFGLQAPIFAFSHCRDVVAETCLAGGMGVFGGSTFTPEQLEQELSWLDAHTGGRPYGVDLLIPNAEYRIPDKLKADPKTLLPREHTEFIEELMREHNVPALKDGESEQIRLEYIRSLAFTREEAEVRLEVVYRHKMAQLIVSALGIPSPATIERAHGLGLKVGALIGKPEHARRQVAAGVDLIIAQGHEAAGHTGNLTTMILVPEVVDLVAPVPVLAAGGIGRGRQMAAALALGAEGVWCGTIWLGTVESEVSPEIRKKLYAATSADTMISRSDSGKPARRLTSAWMQAWNSPEAPKALEMPLQGLLVSDARVRMARHKAEDLLTYPAGQVVGLVNEPTTVRQVFYSLLEEFGETVERLSAMTADRD
ncbi:nitronate monooxygenase family protein [Ramlibacter sp. PS3R-8]|uniref:nitronate monooxygenase n=1 Tax=Ramlibacter sp. PS3R-8 TaxID=3133437 RepID=UPI0030A56F53